MSEPLIGQVVFDALDLIADCTNRTLAPRYPAEVEGVGRWSVAWRWGRRLETENWLGAAGRTGGRVGQ